MPHHQAQVLSSIPTIFSFTHHQARLSHFLHHSLPTSFFSILPVCMTCVHNHPKPFQNPPLESFPLEPKSQAKHSSFLSNPAPSFPPNMYPRMPPSFDPPTPPIFATHFPFAPPLISSSFIPTTNSLSHTNPPFPQPTYPLSSSPYLQFIPHHHAHQSLFTSPSYMPTGINDKSICNYVHKEAESVSIGVVKVQFSVKMSCQTSHTGLFWAGYFWPVDQAESSCSTVSDVCFHVLTEACFVEVSLFRSLLDYFENTCKSVGTTQPWICIEN